MPEQEPEFDVLMGRLQQGDEAAAQEFLRRYGPHLLRVVRRKLGPRLRTRFDSLDFVQDVWASFFANPSDRRRFDRPEALVKFLAAMACHKVADACRGQLQTRKRDLNREHSLDSAAGGAELMATHATPSRAVSAKEEWDRLLRDQPPRHRGILVLLGEGNTCEEIARKLGINEKTVRRVLRRVGSGQSA